MDDSGYQFALEIYSEDGRAVGRARIDPDWEPAVEWAAFLALRRDRRLAAVTAAGAGAVRPVWHPQAGEPYLAGFRVVIPTPAGGSAGEFPVEYFSGLAHQA